MRLIVEGLVPMKDPLVLISGIPATGKSMEAGSTTSMGFSTWTWRRGASRGWGSRVSGMELPSSLRRHYSRSLRRSPS